MEPGKETDLDKYFRKILFSIFFGLLWLIGGITAGIYYQMGFFNGQPVLYNIIFYAGLITGLVFLIRYYIRLWEK